MALKSTLSCWMLWEESINVGLSSWIFNCHKDLIYSIDQSSLVIKKMNLLKSLKAKTQILIVNKKISPIIPHNNKVR